MSEDVSIFAVMLLPVAGAFLIALFHRQPNIREAVTLMTAGALALIVLSLVPEIYAGARPAADGFTILPGMEIAFRVEPLGMLFAMVASSLWVVNSIYSIGYMRGNNEHRQTMFYVCFAIAIAATMGVAFSANLITLFLFYEILTLSTYPLVTHKATEEAVRGGRIYLTILLGTSMVLFLPAIIWTYVLSGTMDFTPGGILAGKVGAPVAAVLLGLFVFGIGKAALMPFHFWLPAAMVAPTPVSALLHAVAVVKAGVFTVAKVVIYIFGPGFLSDTGAGEWLVFVAAFSLIAASLIAMTKDNLKARLAYSTVSQLAYVVLGASFANTMGLIGGGMQIAMHAAGKITLFFCAGAIYVATRKTEISDMAGIGRTMPVTMFAFLVGSLSIIGLPPLGGTWAKWFIAAGAIDAGQLFVIAVLIVSALLNIAYLLPIVVRGYMLPPPGMTRDAPVRIREAPFACVLALSVTALACVVLFFLAGAIEDLLAGAVSQTEPLRAGGG